MSILTDGEVQNFDNSSPANQLAQIGLRVQTLENGGLPSGSISTSELADGILSADAAGRLKVADDFFNETTATAKFADQSIATALIKDLNVTTGKINDIAVTSGKLASDSVTTAKILDANVTPAKLSEIPFQRTQTITSAAAATPVNILLTADVPASKKVYLQGFMARVNGATVWATTATVKIQDNNGTPVDFVTLAVADLTANARVFLNTGATVCEDAFANGTGGTAQKGLQLVGDANGTGSDLIVTVWGVIK